MAFPDLFDIAYTIKICLQSILQKSVHLKMRIDIIYFVNVLTKSSTTREITLINYFEAVTNRYEQFRIGVKVYLLFEGNFADALRKDQTSSIL